MIAVCFVGSSLGAAETIEVESVVLRLLSEADVPAQEAGVLTEVAVREGDAVKKGAVLARIDDQVAKMAELAAKLKYDVAHEKATNDVYEAVVDGFRAWADAQVLGSAFDESTTMGPLASKRQLTTTRRFVHSGLSSGFRLVAGGPDAPVPAVGYFAAPTVFADVDNTTELAQEEVFGPVVCIITAADEADAVRLANESRYGLAATVWTSDLDHGRRLAARLDAGTVGINGYRPDLGVPFGGVKDSGTGRENGREGLAAYLRPDSVYVFAP